MANDTTSLEQKLSMLIDQFNEMIYRTSGTSKYSSLIQYFTGIDRFGNSIIEPSVSTNGYVFFGRPKLNLSTSAIKNDRILSLLNTTDPSSINFAIRCLLDPIFANSSSITKEVYSSPLLNHNLPYIPLLTNTCKSVTGWPDPVLELETFEGGFFSETMSFAKGHDDLNRPVDLTLNFRDVMGDPLLFLFTIWFRWIHLATKGIVPPYYWYEEQGKICYSFSIYRFVTDTSGRFIKYWAKATGCILKSYPIGKYMDYDVSNRVITPGNDISIPVTCWVEYMDPIILKEFNMWMKRWNPSIESYDNLTQDEVPYYNFYGIPYIDTTTGTNELVWKVNRAELPEDPETFLIDFKKQIENL